MSERFPRIASLRTPARLRAHLDRLGVALPCDETPESGATSPLGKPLLLGAGREGPLCAGNRFVVQPMEGWDGTRDGRPTELTRRRWRRFGESGAGWIWGGEAVAVHPDGRANPNQLVVGAETVDDLAGLRIELLEAARLAGHAPPVVGLQLTHSGRWSRPEGEGRPRIAFRHPLLDPRVNLDDPAAMLSDPEVDRLIQQYGTAAKRAEQAGFSFVDIKHCHGYLLHEFLAARSRTGKYGGESLQARMVLCGAILAAVRAAAPGLRIGVRLSLFDSVPYAAGAGGQGAMEAHSAPYRFGFGVNAEDPTHVDLAEPIRFARTLLESGVSWVNVTAASPYYAPHLQRPALFPPSDGYDPPEDPLFGVARLLRAARDLKRALPELTVISSGWSYLQEFVPHVAQACVREGWFDAVGLGRMVLSYPELPADVLAGRAVARKKICRTFSDCTTAPRNGLVSGCYPLDSFYRELPARKQLEAAKRDAQ